MKKIFYFYYLSLNFINDHKTIHDIIEPPEESSLYIKFSRTYSGHNYSKKTKNLEKFYISDILLIIDSPIKDSIIPLSSGRPIPVSSFSLLSKEIESIPSTLHEFNLFGFKEERRIGNWSCWIESIKVLYESECFEEIRNIVFF